MILQAWETYIESLCAAHTDLAHGGTTRRWLPFTSEEAAPLQGTKSPYVRHISFSMARRDDELCVYTSVLQFAATITTGTNLPAAITAARALTEAIMLQFDARIRRDDDAGQICDLLEHAGASAATPIGIIDQAEYGWEYAITLYAYPPEYNAAKWSE